MYKERKTATTSSKGKLKDIFILDDEKVLRRMYGSVISNHRWAVRAEIWSLAQDQNSHINKQGKILGFKTWKTLGIIYGS